MSLKNTEKKQPEFCEFQQQFTHRFSMCYYTVMLEINGSLKRGEGVEGREMETVSMDNPFMKVWVRWVEIRDPKICLF